MWEWGFIFNIALVIMKRLFVYMAVALSAMFYLSSCEKAQEDDQSSSASDQIVYVNGARYIMNDIYLKVDNGLFMTATFRSPASQSKEDEMSINITMPGCDFNKEYDLNLSSDSGKRYLQVAFSDYQKDSYSVCMLGPNVLNVLKQWGKSETEEVRNAKVAIYKDEAAYFNINIVVDSESLTIKSDYGCWIDNYNFVQQNIK